MHIKFLFICSANINRSPMAAGLFAGHMADRGIDAQIRSAGFITENKSASEHAVTTLSRRGVDISNHSSQLVTAQLLEAQDLILVMAREHLRAAAVAAPGAFSRTFTIKEFVRRGLKLGQRTADQSLTEWLKRAGADRNPSDLLGDSEFDDVEDPIGEGLGRFEDTAQELDLLTKGVAYVLFDGAASTSPRS